MYFPIWSALRFNGIHTQAEPGIWLQEVNEAYNDARNGNLKKEKQEILSHVDV